MEKEKFFKEDCPIEIKKDSKDVAEKTEQRSEMFY